MSLADPTKGGSRPDAGPSSQKNQAFGWQAWRGTLTLTTLYCTNLLVDFVSLFCSILGYYDQLKWLLLLIEHEYVLHNWKSRTLNRGNGLTNVFKPCNICKENICKF
jgi:hypothetical protein